MKIFAEAMELAKKGDRRQAIVLADRFAAESAESFVTADADGLAMIIAPLVNFYQAVEEWELAALKSKDVCALAEKLCPDTSETAGDYTHLATALEHLGSHADAISALENAERHLRGAGVWESYADGYKQRLAHLRQLQSGVPPQLKA